MIGFLISANLIAVGLLIAASLGALPAITYCIGIPFALFSIWIGERLTIYHDPQFRRAIELYEAELYRE